MSLLSLWLFSIVSALTSLRCYEQLSYVGYQFQSVPILGMVPSWLKYCIPQRDLNRTPRPLFDTND